MKKICVAMHWSETVLESYLKSNFDGQTYYKDGFQTKVVAMEKLTMDIKRFKRFCNSVASKKTLKFYKAFIKEDSLKTKNTKLRIPITEFKELSSIEKGYLITADNLGIYTPERYWELRKRGIV